MWMLPSWNIKNCTTLLSSNLYLVWVNNDVSIYSFYLKIKIISSENTFKWKKTTKQAFIVKNFVDN